MILVRTYLAESPIHGIGVFASEKIPKGTSVWVYRKGLDQEYPLDFPSSLSPPAAEIFLKYAYVSKTTGNYILCGDDTRHFNHSDDNNVANRPMPGEQEGVDFAVRDIMPGEELTYDYGIFAVRDPEVP